MDAAQKELRLYCTSPNRDWPSFSGVSDLSRVVGTSSPSSGHLRSKVGRQGRDLQRRYGRCCTTVSGQRLFTAQENNRLQQASTNINTFAPKANASVYGTLLKSMGNKCF